VESDGRGLPLPAHPAQLTAEYPNQAPVRISSASSSHVSSQPVIAALCLVLPHAVLPRATTELWSRPPCLACTRVGRCYCSRRPARRPAPRMVGEAHVSSPLLEQVSRPIAVPEDLRLVVHDKGLSVPGSAIFMPRRPPRDVEAGRIGPEHGHRPRPGRRGRSGQDRLAERKAGALAHWAELNASVPALRNDSQSFTVIL
jgi:hypothetical protein